MDAHPISACPPLAAATALLTAAELPAADLSEQQIANFFFCGPPDALTGLVGLELHGSLALLRSLVVSPAARRAGMGTALLARAEDHARAHGVRRLYLLTATARLFFERRGYQLTAREQCPDAIRATAEFARLCPASAAVLLKQL